MSRRGCHIAVLAIACLVWGRLQQAASSSCQHENTTTSVKVPIGVEICKGSDSFKESLKLLDENDNLEVNLDIGGSGKDVWIETRSSGNQSMSIAVEQHDCLNLEIILHDEETLHILSSKDSKTLSLTVPHAASIRVVVKQQPDSKTCFHGLTEAPSMVDHEVLPLTDVVTVVPDEVTVVTVTVVMVTVAVLVGMTLVQSVVMLVLTVWM